MSARRNRRARTRRTGILVLIAALLVGLAGAASTSGGTLSPVNFVSPAEDATVSGTIDFNISTNDSANYTELRHNQSAATFANLTWPPSGMNGTHSYWVHTGFNTTANLDDGVVEFNASAFNTSTGKVAGWRTITVSVDNGAPTISKDTPGDGASVSGTIYVNASATDAGTSVETFRYRWMNTSGGNVSGWNDINTEFDTTTLWEQDYNIELWANDSSGNSAAVNVTGVTVDNTAPNGMDDLELRDVNLSAVKKFSPLVDRVLDTNEVGLNWSNASSSELTDDNTLAKLMVEARNRSFDRSSAGMEGWSGWYHVKDITTISQREYNMTLDSNHEYRFRVVAVDAAGNRNASNTINVSVDTTPPQFGLANGHADASPFNWTNSENVTLEARVVDMSGVRNFTGPHDNTTAINMSLNVSGEVYRNLTVSGGDGDAALDISTVDKYEELDNFTQFEGSVHATDMFGQRNTSINWTFNTDYTPPASINVTNTSAPQYGGWYRDEAEFNVSCVDHGAGVDTWVFDGTTSATQVNTISYEGAQNSSFACRDRAGNENSTTLQDIAIDNDDPVLSGEDPTGNDVAADVNVSVSFSDSGSGVDSTYRKLVFEGGEETSNADWDYGAGEVTYLAEDLSQDTNYDVRVTVCDAVADSLEDPPHCTTSTWEFNTKANTSSADTFVSGTTSEPEPSLSVESVEDLRIRPGRSKDMAFVVENDGDGNLSDIDLTYGVDALGTSFFPEGFDLEEGEQQDVALTVSVPNGTAPGVKEGTLRAEASDGTLDDRTLEVEVIELEAEMRIVAGPDEVDVTPGNETAVDYTIENQGTADAEEVTLAVSAENVSGTVDPSSGAVQQGGDANVTVTFTANASVTVGVYDATVQLFHDSGDRTRDVEIKVQPASDAERQQIEQGVSDLRRQVGALANNTTATRLTALISQAETAMEDGDYARAAEIRRYVAAELPERESGAGLPVVDLLLALVVLGILSVAGYAVIAQRKGEQTRVPGYSSRLGPVRPSKSRGYSYEDDRSVLEKIVDAVHAFLEWVHDEIYGPSQRKLDEFREKAADR